MCPLRRFYEKNFSKVKIYDRTLWKSYAATVAFLSSIITLISFFNTAEESCIGISGWITIYIIMLVGSFRFLYKGIIIKHNKTEPTYTKTSLFLCEKRRFFMGRTEKGGKVF